MNNQLEIVNTPQDKDLNVIKHDSARARPGPSMTPQNLQEAIQFSGMIAKSDLAPKDYKGKPENVLIALQMGSEVGLAPMQAIQNIAVINGRPCIWGDAALAIVQASGRLEWIKEWKEGNGDSETAHCETKRSGYPESRITTFSAKDAKDAGLWGRQGPWQNYKSRMLQMRARGFNLRDQFADVLKGLSIAEEVEDYQVSTSPSPTFRNTQANISETVRPQIEDTEPRRNLISILEDKVKAGGLEALALEWKEKFSAEDRKLVGAAELKRIKELGTSEYDDEVAND